MITAGAEYQAYEALTMGARPVVRVSILPHYWPNGVDGLGTFDHARFISPDRIQANYEGFSVESIWLSAIVTANPQVVPSPAVISWNWNSPGYDMEVWWRTSSNLSDFDSPTWGWTEVANGETVQLQTYYQFSVALNPYRAWVVQSLADADGFTAYAEAAPGGSAYQGYAAGTNVAGDSLTYIELLQILGEYYIDRDIEQAGTVSQEAPKDFSDIVAGDHSGLLLNNRQGYFTGSIETDDLEWHPAPLYSPNKSSFLFAGEDWYGKMLRVLLGWDKGISFEIAAPGTGYVPGQILTVVQAGASGLRLMVMTITGGGVTGPVGSLRVVSEGYGYSVASGLVTTVNEGGGANCTINLLALESYTEFITLFLGKITKWGPVARAVDQDGKAQPHTVEIYAKDFIADCLQKRICLPASDGSPNPLTFGEYLCKAEAVSGWSPEAILKAAYFEDNDFSELDAVVESGGGACSIITPGLTGGYSFRAAVTGANQVAYGALNLYAAGEMFVTGNMKIVSAPATPSNLNSAFMNIAEADGDINMTLALESSGQFYSVLGGESKFNALAYIGVSLPFVLWHSPTNPGYFKLWINGDEVLTYQGDLSAQNPIQFRFGVQTGAVAESWTVDFDDIQIRTKYYHNAFRVTGAPFADIGPVYIDNLGQPNSKTVGAFTQTLTRHPSLGIVQFESTDPDLSVSGEVLVRVVENAGGRHALYIVEQLLAAAGVTDYIDATALAAAYAAVPDDIINARFEGGSSDQRGLKDFANLGLTVADALKEVCSRCLYWIFTDAGKIKIIPYTGTPPTSPVKALTSSNLREAAQTIDMDQINSFVTAIYGWYSRNPLLFYIAGTPEAGGQGTGLDFSWDSPVACENPDTVEAKVDLFLKFLNAYERLEPVRTSLAEARLELMDPVSVNDVMLGDVARDYLTDRKEVGLDPGSRETTLQLMRFLGES